MRVRVRSPQTGGACGVGLHAEQGVQGVLRGRGGAIGAEFCAAKCQHSQAEMRTSRVATHAMDSTPLFSVMFEFVIRSF